MAAGKDRGWSKASHERLNLKESFRCRFAAGAVTVNNRLNGALYLAASRAVAASQS